MPEYTDKLTPRLGKLAALEVKKQIARGEKPNVYRAMLKVGYAKSSAESGIAKNTKEYKQEMMDVEKAMEAEREQCFIELKDKNVRKTASYRDRIEAINKLTNQIQLLTGRKTSNDSLSISWESEED